MEAEDKTPRDPGGAPPPGGVPPGLVDFIRDGSSFLVAGHLEPDGDCVGSQLALCSALERLGKTAVPCSAGPFKRAEILAYAPRFTAAPEPPPGARVVILDCAGPERTGDLGSYLENLPTAVIDHHASGAYAAGEAPGGLIYSDPAAPATALLVLRLLKALGLTPTEGEAELLFFGLCTDTGFFRHLDRRGDFVFEAAAELLRAGACPKVTYDRINGGKSLDSRILAGRILARVESYFDGRLALSTEEYEESRRYGLEGRDSDAIYQMLLAARGVEAIVLLRQEEPDKVNAAFRSRDAVDVGAVARIFGGGGHKNAAGLTRKGTVPELKPLILDAFRPVLGTSP